LRWFDLQVVPLQGVESQFVVSHYNTTAAKATVMARQHVLTESVEHIQAVLDNMADGVVTISANGSIESFNQAACAMFGYTAESILGSNIEVLMPEPDHSHHRTYISRYLSTGEARLIGNPREVKGRRKDGTVFPMSIAVSRIDRHGVLTFVGVMRDLSRQRQDEAAIHRLAYYDTLTGLPNRHLLLERMRNAVVECGRTGQHGAVMFLDLDHFKALNDSLGHAAGDALLQEVATRLRHAVREGDSVARMGGDEFLVLLEGLSIHLHEAASQTEFIGKKLREALEQEYLLQGRSYHCTPSIGVVLFLEAHETVEELVKRADVAMYQAKTAGRNTLRFYDPAMQAAFDSHAELENDLRQGLVRGEFVLHYQVQVDRQGDVLGAEALVRWNHPVRGMVSPAQFIPLAEQTGLILPLGRWVLDTACAQLVAWAASAHSASWTLAVNVSASQFAQSSFVQEVSAAIDKTGANPQRLKLELTESMLVQDVDDIVLKMHAIKRAWVGFSLDDFGTGYSSLAYLKRLPLNQLKIDQSFVRDVMTDPSDA
ncbi:MAG: diguanylate cyclase, partial [Burkholderiales bacterium PBB4]